MATFTDKYTLAKPDEEDYYSIEDFNGNMDIIDDQLGEFDEKIEEMDTSIGSLNSRMSEIDNSVGSSNESIGNVQETVDSIDSNISDLKTTVNTINTNVAGVKTTTDTINTNVASTKTAVDTVNTNVASTKTAVDTVNTNVASTKTAVDTVNTNVASVKTTTDTINTNVASVKTTTDTVNTNVNSIKTTVSSMNSYLTGSSSGNSLLDEIQKTSGKKYYTASNNIINLVQNVDLTNAVSTSGTYKHIKLIDFLAEHSGCIRLCFDFYMATASVGSTINAYIFEITNNDTREIPLLIPFSYADPTSLVPACTQSRQIHSSVKNVYDYTFSMDIPVIAGQNIIMTVYYTALTDCVVKRLGVGYDICNEE